MVLQEKCFLEKSYQATARSIEEAVTQQKQR